MNLKQYYKAFWSLSGALAAAPPIIAAVVTPFLPDSASFCGFPPMGDVGTFARLGLLCLAVLVTYLVYFWRGGKWLLSVAALLAFLSLCAYLALYPRFVLRVDIPSLKTTTRVSVGYDRTPFAKAHFSSDSDEDMLRARGFDDEEIKKLWTYRSLIVARLVLFGSYCGFILGLVAAFSLGVVLGQSEKGILNRNENRGNDQPTRR
jgi:hypothetical protein